MKYIDAVVNEVIKHEALGAKTFIIGKSDGTEMPSFRAGQYISVRLNIGTSRVSRPYSICSSPMDALKGFYAITVQANPQGFAADWMLAHIRKGTKLMISYPQGSFFYRKNRDCKNMMALAGGSGITPFLSMAKSICEGTDNFNLTILYGNSDEKNILFKKELEEICTLTDKVKVVNVLSDEKKDGFESGFINASLVKKYAEGDYSVFVCGPGSMYNFLNKDLKKLNIPDRFLRTEMLAVTKDPQSVEADCFTIIVKQGSQEYTVKALSKEPILVALERAGINAPSCCRSGKCGWCSSRVLRGTYYAPSENEGRSFIEKLRKHIHPCASFPTSDMTIEIPE